MAAGKIFKTLQEFNCGYAGPQTLLLEKTSRELAGRQDDFCLICGDTDRMLFPQLGPKEIHLCPRRFCRKCYYIQDDWTKSSNRFQDDIYNVRDFVTQCCSLCWKRGWDVSCPLLGQDQPELLALAKDKAEDILRRRYKFWEECAVDKQWEPYFKWRLPLLELPDDMSIDSDRNLVKAMEIRYIKRPLRFRQFGKKKVRKHPPPPVVTFDVGNAFADMKRMLCDLVSPSATDDEREADEEGETERENWKHDEEEAQADEDEDEEDEYVPKSWHRTVESRPQRHASRLSFVNGYPTRQKRSSPKMNPTKNRPNSDQIMLDRQISSSMASRSPPSQFNRPPRDNTIATSTSGRRGRPRKSLTTSNPLPPSPTTQEDDAAPASSSVQDKVVDDEDSEPENESYKQIKTILKADRAPLEAQIRLMKDELGRSQSTIHGLEQERQKSAATEIDLRSILSVVEIENLALQGAITDSKEQHERHLQHVAELTAKFIEKGEHMADHKRLQKNVENYERKLKSLKTDLEASKAQVVDINNMMAEQQDAYEQTLESLQADLQTSRAREVELGIETVNQRGDYEQKLESLKAGLEGSQAQEADLNNVIVDQHDAYDALQKKLEDIEEQYKDLVTENEGLSKGIAGFSKGAARRDREIKELKKATGTMGRKTDAIHSLREEQDDVMEANKQLRKDVASLAAELAFDRGLKGFNGARLQQTLACSSLTSELVDRLMQNPFLDGQMAEKVTKRPLNGRGSGSPQSPRTSPAKRRRVEPMADVTARPWPPGDSEPYD